MQISVIAKDPRIYFWASHPSTWALGTLAHLKKSEKSLCQPPIMRKTQFRAWKGCEPTRALARGHIGANISSACHFAGQGRGAKSARDRGVVSDGRRRLLDSRGRDAPSRRSRVATWRRMLILSGSLLLLILEISVCSFLWSGAARICSRFCFLLFMEIAEALMLIQLFWFVVSPLKLSKLGLIENWLTSKKRLINFSCSKNWLRCGRSLPRET